VPNTPPNGPPPSKIQTAPNLVGFDPKLVVPSQTIYFQRNDLIEFFVISNLANGTVRVNYRWLTPEGEIKEGELDAVIGAGSFLFTVPLYEGWLLSFAARVVTAFPAGSWCFLQAMVVRPFANLAQVNPQAMIWQGYLGNLTVNGFPGTPSKEITDGPGVVRSIAGAAPAAGAQILETVPANRSWTLLMLRAQLVTSAAVANRFPSFKITDGANILFTIGTNVAQVAATSSFYHIAPGNQFYNDTQGNFLIPFPSLTQIKAGFRIQTVTPGMDPADQWSLPQYLVLEWGMWDA